MRLLPAGRRSGSICLKRKNARCMSLLEKWPLYFPLYYFRLFLERVSRLDCKSKLRELQCLARVYIWQPL